MKLTGTFIVEQVGRRTDGNSDVIFNGLATDGPLDADELTLVGITQKTAREIGAMFGSPVRITIEIEKAE